eukprot:scaffold67484_cov67-Phaeocystis_antarctica.AAC.7
MFELFGLKVALLPVAGSRDHSPSPPPRVSHIGGGDASAMGCQTSPPPSPHARACGARPPQSRAPLARAVRTPRAGRRASQLDLEEALHRGVGDEARGLPVVLLRDAAVDRVEELLQHLFELRAGVVADVITTEGRELTHAERAQPRARHQRGAVWMGGPPALLRIRRHLVDGTVGDEERQRDRGPCTGLRQQARQRELPIWRVALCRLRLVRLTVCLTRLRRECHRRPNRPSGRVREPQHARACGFARRARHEPLSPVGPALTQLELVSRDGEGRRARASAGGVQARVELDASAQGSGARWFESQEASQSWQRTRSRGSRRTSGPAPPQRRCGAVHAPPAGVRVLAAVLLRQLLPGILDGGRLGVLQHVQQRDELTRAGPRVVHRIEGAAEHLRVSASHRVSDPVVERAGIAVCYAPSSEAPLYARPQRRDAEGQRDGLIGLGARLQRPAVSWGAAEQLDLFVRPELHEARRRVQVERPKIGSKDAVAAQVLLRYVRAEDANGIAVFEPRGVEPLRHREKQLARSDITGCIHTDACTTARGCDGDWSEHTTFTRCPPEEAVVTAQAEARGQTHYDCQRLAHELAATRRTHAHSQGGRARALGSKVCRWRAR